MNEKIFCVLYLLIENVKIFSFYCPSILLCEDPMMPYLHSLFKYAPLPGRRSYGQFLKFCVAAATWASTCPAFRCCFSTRQFFIEATQSRDLFVSSSGKYARGDI